MAGSIEGCKEYSKLGIPGKQGELLCRKGYLLSHSSENKTPIWVIEHLTAEKASGTLPRYNKFQPDPDLEERAIGQNSVTTKEVLTTEATWRQQPT